MMLDKSLRVAICGILVGLTWMYAGAANAQMKTVQAKHPRLASGALMYAKLGDLPEGLLVQGGDVKISQEELDKFIAEARKGIKAEFEAFPFFALEQEATQRILKKLAQKHNDRQEGESAVSADNHINAYLDEVVTTPDVTDAEIADYYDKMKERIGNVPLKKVRNRIRTLLKRGKRQTAIHEYIRTLGKRTDITVSRDYAEEQAKLAKQNPIDQARSSDKPVLAVFSSTNCCGPDTTQPMIEKIKRELGDSLELVHLDVQEKRVLSARFHIRNVPAFVLYNTNGEEVFRHVGDIGVHKLLSKIERAKEG